MSPTNRQIFKFVQVPNQESAGCVDFTGTLLQIPFRGGVVSSVFESTKHEEMKNEIWALRDYGFSKVYNEFSTQENDFYDRRSCVLYSLDANGKVTSTARVVFDSWAFGLPSDEHVGEVLNGLRNSGKNLAELSKLVITPAATRGMIKHYMKSVYALSVVGGVSSLIITCLARSASFYCKTVGAKILVPDIGYRFGIDEPFALLEWDVMDTKQPLKKWLNEELA